MTVRSVLLLVVAATAAISARFSAADEPSGKKLALLVGVMEYDHSQLNALQFPENDVEELAEILRGQKFEVVLLTTKLGKKEEKLLPTAANIKARLADLLKNVTKHDVMLVGLAGHGIQPLGSDKAYFCPKDANPTIREGKGKDPSFVAFPERLVGIDELLGAMDDSGVGQKLLLVDACRNDPGVRGRRGVDRVRVSALPPETGVLLSCSNGQFAFEHKSWGKGGHGAFFAAVIDGLNGGAGQDGSVTWESLGPYVRRRVPAMVKEVYGMDGGAQRPNLIANISETSAILATVATPVPKKPEPLPQPAPKESTNDSTSPPKKELVNSISMEFILIPAGEFMMGSPDSEEGRQDGVEKPQHRVEITKPFYLGKYEVTRGQFRKFVTATNYKTQAEKNGSGWGWGFNGEVDFVHTRPEFNWRNFGVNDTDEHPVMNVTWNDAVAFCNWMSEQEKQTYRLPTEAEWEYSCRATTDTRWSSGDDESGLKRIANLADESHRAKFSDEGWKRNGAAQVPWNDFYAFSSPVGKFPANKFGLHDMHGNVSEWCQDRYTDEYYKDSPTKDPQGPEKSQYRVFRGGSFETGSNSARAARRGFTTPDNVMSGTGFRVFRAISVKSE